MWLKDYLESRQLTYKEFAKMIGVHVTTISNYINFKRTPALWVALRIEEMTKGKVTVEDMYTYRQENKKNG